MRRRQGRLQEASVLIDELLKAPLNSNEAGQLYGEKVLLEVGVRSLEQFALPRQETRDSFLRAIEGLHDIFEILFRFDDHEM